MSQGHLRNKFLGVTAALILTLGAFVVVLIRQSVADEFVRELREKSSFVAHHFSHIAASYLLTEDFQQLTLDLVALKRQDREIEYAFVLDKQGKLISNSQKHPISKELLYANIVEPGRPENAVVLLTENGQIFDIAKPIMHGELGTLRVGFSEEPLFARVRAIVNSTLGLVMAVLFFSLVAAYLTAHRLTRPLGELVDMARKIGGGELAQRVTVRRQDEIGELAGVFNQMAEDLSGSLVSREYLESVVDAMGEALFVIGKDGCIDSVNKCACELTGVDRDEILGRPFESLLKIPNMPVSLSGNKRHAFETELVTPDGRSVALIMSFGHFDSDDADSRIVIVARDIADIKKAEKKIREAHEFFRSVLNSIPDAISIIDPKTFRIVGANQAFLDEFGQSENDVLGKHCYAITHGRESVCEAPAHVCPLAAEHSGGAHNAVEHIHEGADGIPHYVEVRTSPIHDPEGKVAQVVHTSRDISDRKKTETTLASQAKQQATVAELGKMALTEPDLSRFMEKTVLRLAETLNADYGKILRLIPEQNHLVLQAGFGWKPEPARNATVGTGTASHAGYTLQSAEPVVVEDFSKETRFHGNKLLVSHHVISGISVPVSGPEDRYGILGAYFRRQRNFSVDDVHFVQAVGALVSAAVKQKDIEEKLCARQQELLKQHAELNALFRKVESAKQQWESTMDCMGDMVVLAGPDGTIRRCNSRYVNFAGKTYAEIIGQSWDIPFGPIQGMHENGTHWEQEYFHAESERWYAIQSHPVENPTDSKEDGVVITLRDFTDLKNASQELEQTNIEIELSRAGLQEALGQISELIQRVATEQELGIRYDNPDLAPCYKVKKCGKKDCPSFGNGNTRCWEKAGTMCGGTVQGTFAKKLGNCSACEVYRDAMSNPLHRIGEQFNQMMQMLEEKNRELGDAYAQLKNTQSQILQQEKMASIGQLAAGVAHEINNPMGFISSNIGTFGKYVTKLGDFIGLQDGALRRLDSGELPEEIKGARRKLKLDYILEDVRDLIQESLEGADRVRTIVKNLKSFSRVDEADMQAANINECIESTLNIAWNELKYTCTVEKRLGDLPLTYCHPQQLNQVFMNLLVNAAHAIEAEGVVTIETRATADTIFVSIQDTGCGMTEEVRKRIFEPFYTTKEVGKGTGLGLSITYDIIQSHDGEIQVESTPGQGTSFHIRIPVVTEETLEARADAETVTAGEPGPTPSPVEEKS